MNENPVESEVDSAPALPATPAPVSFDPRRRIRELLAIPDRDRTDAEWDELNELEIQTAPGNRAAGGQALAYPSNNKPAGFHSKNRMKSKGKPGGGRPPQQQNKPNPNNKPPRPA